MVIASTKPLLAAGCILFSGLTALPPAAAEEPNAGFPYPIE